jgi:PilZ domain
MKVVGADRRQTVRHNFRTPIGIRRWKSVILEERGESENLSENGILFATDSVLAIGTLLEIELKMPEVVTGVSAAVWLCSGHVVRVEPIVSPWGKQGISVQFDCYEVNTNSRLDPLEAPYRAGESKPLLLEYAEQLAGLTPGFRVSRIHSFRPEARSTNDKRRIAICRNKF